MGATIFLLMMGAVPFGLLTILRVKEPVLVPALLLAVKLIVGVAVLPVGVPINTQGPTLTSQVPLTALGLSLPKNKLCAVSSPKEVESRLTFVAFTTWPGTRFQRKLSPRVAVTVGMVLSTTGGALFGLFATVILKENGAE